MDDRKRILLTSVFKPCGVDDVYGRKENRPEALHTQLTQVQGVFSLRERNQNHRLYVLANNLEHPVTVLDWPTLKRYRKEIRKGYDYIGISFIQPNFLKAKKMVELARELAPQSKIVVGGHGTMIDDIENILEADYFCRGEGIRFLRKLLGEPEDFQYRHPFVPTMESLATMGVPVRMMAFMGRFVGMKYANTSGVIVNGLGCTGGCDFCSTGHFFDPPRITFIKSGREIYRVMQEYEKLYKIRNFMFIGDENVFSDRRRTEELHQAMKEGGKYYAINLLWSSMDNLNRYDPKFLSELGLEVVWPGIESKLCPYPKNEGLDIAGILAGLRRYGIKTVLSSILCLDCHTKENIWEDIDYHISLKPTFSQMAHYSPPQGTTLWRRLIEEDRILHAIPLEDRFGFSQIWFQHPHFTPRESGQIQKAAYEKEYQELGPSIVRWVRVNYESYPHLVNSGSEMLARRAAMIKNRIGHYRIILRAAELLVPNEKMSREIRDLRREIEKDFGRTRVHEHLVGVAMYLWGRGYEAKTRYFGDDIPLRTRVMKFNQG